MYTLRFPFTLPEGREIGITERSVELNGLSVSLAKQDRYYVLTITGFSTEEEASHYLNYVWAGLMWVLLHRGLPPAAAWELQKVRFPEALHQAARNTGLDGLDGGLIDGAWPAVYPESKQIRTLTAGQINPLVTTPSDHVLKFFREGIAFPASDKVIDDGRLRVALDLYGAFFSETSENAKFLTLVIALEALATGTPRTQLALDLQVKWLKELDELQRTIDPEPDDADSLEALRNDLQSRRADSIGNQIRTLVFSTLEDNGDEDAAEMAIRAKRIYGHRSTLVHKGKLERGVLQRATSDAKVIVERVLRARFVHRANPANE